ncbi:MAG: hypothetical protein C0404_00435 [Verrucomicrobia bacterium]|nr:hypothetical protein [Verrucomicrobiota bacterium]
MASRWLPMAPNSTNVMGVAVTGNLGPKYIFSGTIQVGDNNTFLARDFAIRRTDDKTAENAQ